MKLIKTEIKTLKTFTRVIDEAVISFSIVKKTIKFLGIEFTSKGLQINYDKSKIPKEKQYMIDMGIKSAEYNILFNEHELLTNHLD